MSVLRPVSDLSETVLQAVLQVIGEENTGHQARSIAAHEEREHTAYPLVFPLVLAPI